MASEASKELWYYDMRVVPSRRGRMIMRRRICLLTALLVATWVVPALGEPPPADPTEQSRVTCEQRVQHLGRRKRKRHRPRKKARKHRRHQRHAARR
jgi:hypothetical protein